jgi:hypothetical protein
VTGKSNATGTECPWLARIRSKTSSSCKSLLVARVDNDLQLVASERMSMRSQRIQKDLHAHPTRGIERDTDHLRLMPQHER